MPPKKVVVSVKPAASKSASGTTKSASAKPTSGSAKPKSMAAAAASAKPKSMAAAVAAKLKSRDRPDNSCRVKAYEKYRADCAKAFKDGGPDKCSLIDQCQSYGVGSEFWPVEVWQLPPENVRNLSRELVQEGKKCMTRTMWSDPRFIDSLKGECGATGEEQVAQVKQQLQDMTIPTPAEEIRAMLQARAAAAMALPKPVSAKKPASGKPASGKSASQKAAILGGARNSSLW
jgi:hypothetical protein